MPRQSDSRSRPRRPATPRPRRSASETQRKILQAVGADEERLGSALKKVDAQTGAAVVSHLGHQVGNVALGRALLNAGAVTEADHAITISFASSVDESDFTPAMRAILEAVLRAAMLHSALVVRVGRKGPNAFFDVAPSSVNESPEFERAAAASSGLACFLKPPRYPAYHFEVRS